MNDDDNRRLIQQSTAALYERMGDVVKSLDQLQAELIRSRTIFLEAQRAKIKFMVMGTVFLVLALSFAVVVTQPRLIF